MEKVGNMAGGRGQGYDTRSMRLFVETETGKLAGLGAQKMTHLAKTFIVKA